MIAPRTPPRVRCQFLKCFIHRGVAQPGSAPPWGGGGRRFKSSRPDQHPCRGVRIPGQPSSLTTGVRRYRALPSRPDQFASLRVQLRSQTPGRPSVICPFGGATDHWTVAKTLPRHCRDVQIPSRPSSSRASLWSLRTAMSSKPIHTREMINPHGNPKRQRTLASVS